MKYKIFSGFGFERASGSISGSRFNANRRVPVGQEQVKTMCMLS